MPIFFADGIPSYSGVCLFETEANHYHDSDFFMTIWDVEKEEPRSICFASTRGSCGQAMNSHADATPEIRDAYFKYSAYHARRNRIINRRLLRKQMWKDIKAAEINFNQYKRLHFCYNRGEMDLIMRILISKKIRSSFKLSIRTQIIKWLHEENPVYRTPISRKQMMYI